MRTLKRYIDEIKLRINRLDVNLELSDEDICNQINIARQTIFGLTKNIFPERYGKIIVSTTSNTMKETSMSIPYYDLTGGVYSTKLAIPYKISLPIDFLEPWVCIFRYIEDNIPYNVECRFIDRKELQNIVNDKWHRPNIISPVYLCETKFLDEVSTINYSLYDVTGTTYNNPDSLLIYGLGDILGEVELWYISKLPILEYSTFKDEEELSIPPEFDELITIIGAIKCLEFSNRLDLANILEIEKQNVINLMEESYRLLDKVKTVYLPSNEPTERQ